MDPTADMSLHPGFSNPAHSSDDIQLKSITPIDSSPRVQSNESQTSPEKPQKITNGKSRGNGASEVFALCCSSSGHVPPATKDDGNVEATACDVRENDDDKEGHKQGHSALERQLGIEYSVTDLPPIHMCILFGLQVKSTLRIFFLVFTLSFVFDVV